MSLPRRYNPHITEPNLLAQWQSKAIYEFREDSEAPVFSIDTPPPTVSGNLHLGHTFSYSHPDFIARFWRMNGYNVFYPMGFDDNGLPTERLVEQQVGKRAEEIGRKAFIDQCLNLSEKSERDYRNLWQRMGLSIDWRFTYRTIDERSRRISQLSFIELVKKNLAYKKDAPTIWCPECVTAIAQAELNDIERQSEFITLKFPLVSEVKIDQEEEVFLQIATTRPELLPACVAIFVHPEDKRYSHLIGKIAEVPLFKQRVSILVDPLVDPEKGTGIVMCCTFGDQTDVTWWNIHKLDMVEAIDRYGRMTGFAGIFEGLTIPEARARIKNTLEETGYLISQERISGSIRVHERCDIPVEYIPTSQWFVRVLEKKDELLHAGEQVRWYPPHMKSRYRAWVENLNWDWCISRQRYYGVAFPIWYCDKCSEIVFANVDQLPVDPVEDLPHKACPGCGGSSFTPESDVMDTWATSSMTPQIVGGWLEDPKLYEMVFPFAFRAQAHEIIRTWAFYTLAKSKYHFNDVPWHNALISGWGIAGEGMGKISKSRGGGPMPPMKMIDKYSADAIRYWAASTGPGKDSVISEEKIILGGKLVNKIWNVARFSQPFIDGHQGPNSIDNIQMTPADKWILSKTQKLIRRVTSLFHDYDYAAAKAETEAFFWDFADNYLEMVKGRLYTENSPYQESAKFSLYHVLLTLIKLFAPFLPFVTEKIYQELDLEIPKSFESPAPLSIHLSQWPIPNPKLTDEAAESFGDILVDITRKVRKYKSDHNLPLGTALRRLKLTSGDPETAAVLQSAAPDLLSITRAQEMVTTVSQTANQFSPLESINGDIHLTIEP